MQSTARSICRERRTKDVLISRNTKIEVGRIATENLLSYFRISSAKGRLDLVGAVLEVVGDVVALLLLRSTEHETLHFVVEVLREFRISFVRRGAVR